MTEGKAIRRELKHAVILLVEDNADDALLLKDAFYEANIINPILVLENGKKAIAYLKGEGIYADRKQYPLPILILLDLKLPIVSGFEVLRWVRQHPSLKRLPVLILTSSNIPEDINKAYDLGTNSYLVKPVDFDDLLQVSKYIGVYWMALNEMPDVNVEDC